MLPGIGVVEMAVSWEPTPEDVAVAETIAWSMALEGRELSEPAFGKLLERVASERQGNLGEVGD